MRLLVQDFLLALRERDELDRLLPDLLRSMGYQIVKIAFRGEVENGVDIAALRREGGRDCLFLFQIKAGDITPDLWNGGPNSVRASLQDIEDVEFVDSGNPRVMHAERVVVVVHNGVLRENCRAKWNGFAARYRHQLRRWDVDDLARDVERHLLNEYLLPAEQRHLLRKTLAFIDVPGYDFRHCKELLAHFFDGQPKHAKASVIRRRFSTLRLVMAMIHQYARAADNLGPSLLLSERALLVAWDWFIQIGDRRPNSLMELQKTLELWFHHCLGYLAKIEPAITVEDGLCLSGLHEVVEYPGRCLDIVQLISIALISAMQFGLSEAIGPLSHLLVQCVRNNLAGCCRPQLDSHINAIVSGILGLTATGNRGLARKWLAELLGDLVLRCMAHRALPELLNRMDLVIELEATGQKPSTYVDTSSTLIYTLFELCLLLNDQQTYERHRESFQDVDLQTWYPPQGFEMEIYRSEIQRGKTETGISRPHSLDAFRTQVEARYLAQDIPLLQTVKSPVPLVLLACRHYGTPIPTFIWRAQIMEGQAANS